MSFSFEHCVIQGLLVRYTDQGTGPVVLLLHGWGDQLTGYDALGAKLRDGGYRTIALDFPGFGGTQNPKTPWHVADYARFVQAFLNAIEVREVHALVGHSFGGRVSLVLIARGLLAPTNLILIDSAGVAVRSAARRGLMSAVAKLGAVLTSVYPLNLVRDRLRTALYAFLGASDYLESGPLRDTFVNVINENLLEDARTIRTPTLLVWGAEDDVTPLSEGETLQGAILGSELKVIPEAGHVVHREHPEAVASYMLDFLSHA